MNFQLLILRRKADRRRTASPPFAVVSYAALERALVAAYGADPLAESFNDWVRTVAGDEAHPHHAAAVEYCDLWRRSVVH